MAENRTAKSCYESRYGGGWITAAMRLAEMACERIADSTTLGNRFWQNEPWDKVFVRELTFANRLLKNYSIEAIATAYVSKAGRRVKSLGAPFFKEMIAVEQRGLDLKTNRLEMADKPEIVNTLEKPRPIKRAGKSIRERLADSDNGPTQRGLFDTDESK